MYRYDREARHGEVISEVIFPPIYLHDLEIRGDHFMMIVARSNQRVLYNWKTGSGICLSFVCDNVGASVYPSIS